MGTVHEDAATALMQQLMLRPDDGPALVTLQRQVQAREIPLSYLDVIGQPDPRAGWPMEQIAALMSVHSRIGSGALARVQIELFETPGSDRQGREQNAAVIGDLPAPFTGYVDPSQSNSPYGDGSVEWSDTITSTRSTGTDDEDGYRTFTPMPVVPRAGVPLEIGSTKASVTCAHLARHGAVARWPYGSTVLTIIVEPRFEATGSVSR